MRNIYKLANAHGPYCLQQKFGQGTPSEPTKAWQNLGSDCKQSLIEYYLKPEQYYLCAYSEVNLKTFGCHIEHIKPKNKNRYPEDTFDYHNLIASAFDSNNKNTAKLIVLVDILSVETIVTVNKINTIPIYLSLP